MQHVNEEVSYIWLQVKQNTIVMSCDSGCIAHTMAESETYKTIGHFVVCFMRQHIIVWADFIKITMSPEVHYF